MAIGPPLVEEDEVEELRGMLGKGSFSEPDLSRICNDDDDGQCDECEADSGLQGDPGGGGGGGLLTRQRTWHHTNGGGGREAGAAAVPGRLPVIKEVTSFV